MLREVEAELVGLVGVGDLAVLNQTGRLQRLIEAGRALIAEELAPI
ncbi:hypothetical protein [Ornithinimicrobium kibberense]